MGIPVVETTAITDVTSGASSASVTLPSGIQEFDLILIAFAVDGDAASPTATGYTTIGGVSEGAVEIYYLYKVATSSESNPTVNWTGSEQGRFMAIRISGIDTTTPIDGGSGSATGATTARAFVGGWTTVEDDVLAICAYGGDRATTVAGTTITNTKVNGSGSSGGANGAGLIVGSKGQASPVSTGTWQSGVSGAEEWAASGIGIVGAVPAAELAPLNINMDVAI